MNIDGEGNERHWFFDARNLNTTKVYGSVGILPASTPAASSDFYTQNFDALGRVSIKVDQIGTTTTMVYDLAGRLTSKEYHTGATPAQGGTVTPGGTLESTDTFTYDAASRLLTTNKGRHNVATQHSYAPDSMPLSETLVADGRIYLSSRSYDASNRPLTHTYPNAKATYWAYTARNQVATVHYEDKLVASNTHDAGYRLTNQTYGNNLARTISYGRQDNLRTNDSIAGKVDLQMSYSYAADKQIIAESIVGDVVLSKGFNAQYDSGNRITNWTKDGSVGILPASTPAEASASATAQTWSYDDNGNWNSTTKTIANNTSTENRTHNDTDQITQIANKAAINEAEGKGNLTDYEVNGKEYEVEYDLENRIVKVEVGNQVVEYRYDALGRRVIRKQGTTKSALIWWGHSECAEHKHQAGQTVIQNDIMEHPSRLNSVIARAADGSKFKLEWYHKNYLDHVYAVSNTSGDLIEHYRYTAFGEVTIFNENGNQIATTQIDNHILWNTRRRDEVTGYYMYKFRHYAPELGRWPSRDPIEEDGGVNLYGFVGNNPIKWWDLFGHRRGENDCRQRCRWAQPRFKANCMRNCLGDGWDKPKDKFKTPAISLSYLGKVTDVKIFFPVFTPTTGFYIEHIAKITKGTCCKNGKKSQYKKSSLQIGGGIYAGSPNPSVRVGIPDIVNISGDCPKAKPTSCSGYAKVGFRFGPASASCSWTHGSGWNCSGSLTFSLNGGSFWSTRATASIGVSCSNVEVF